LNINVQLEELAVRKAGLPPLFSLNLVTVITNLLRSPLVVSPVSQQIENCGALAGNESREKVIITVAAD
jgi:hypothetical protein